MQPTTATFMKTGFDKFRTTFSLLMGGVNDTVLQPLARELLFSLFKTGNRAV